MKASTLLLVGVAAAGLVAFVLMKRGATTPRPAPAPAPAPSSGSSPWAEFDPTSSTSKYGDQVRDAIGGFLDTAF